MKSTFISLCILLAVSFVITFPFFRPGFFPTDDGEWAVVRLAEMKREIRDGQIPPRWSDFLNHGYGYPLFHFTYPLPYYVGSAVSASGVGLVDTIKILFVASIVISAAGMFFLARSLAGPWAGTVAALFYVSAPFHLSDLYVRGSLGESLAFSVFPVLCWLGLRFVLRPTLVRMALVALALAVLVTTHNVMALLFTPVWIFFMVAVSITYAENFWPFLVKRLAPMVLLGMGAASYFFLPALVEKQFVVLSQQRLADASANFISMGDYLSSSWFRPEKQLYGIGPFHIAAFVLSILLFVISDAVEKRKHKGFFPFILIAAAGVLFLPNPVFSYLWENTMLASVDFPWRILPVTVFVLSLGTVFLHRFTFGKILAVLLVAGALIYQFPDAKPKEYSDKPDSYYETNDATTTSADELMPLWVKRKPANRPENKVEIVQGEAVISDTLYNSRMVAFRVSSLGASIAQVNTIYFPGWEFTLDGNPVQAEYRNNTQGLMRITVPEGDHIIAGNFVRTRVRRVGEIGTSVSLFVILIFLCTPILTRIPVASRSRPEN